MSDLRDLYQEVILDHSRSPRNFGAIDPPALRAQGYNPLCGDRVEVFIALEGDRLADVRFQGLGCAISTASASLMTEALKGCTRAQALALFRKLHESVTGQLPDGNGAEHVENVELGKLAVLAGVRQYPLRVKCATLPWHAMRNALLGKTEEVVTTE